MRSFIFHGKLGNVYITSPATYTGRLKINYFSHYSRGINSRRDILERPEYAFQGLPRLIRNDFDIAVRMTIKVSFYIVHAEQYLARTDPRSNFSSGAQISKRVSSANRISRARLEMPFTRAPTLIKRHVQRETREESRNWSIRTVGISRKNSGPALIALRKRRSEGKEREIDMLFFVLSFGLENPENRPGSMITIRAAGRYPPTRLGATVFSLAPVYRWHR